MTKYQIIRIAEGELIPEKSEFLYAQTEIRGVTNRYTQVMFYFKVPVPKPQAKVK